MEDLHRKRRYSGCNEIFAPERLIAWRLHDRNRKTIAENLSEVPDLDF